MSKIASKGVNIFLALDKNTIQSYFNPHDTSPIYKRQLSLKFEQYLAQCVRSCKRYDPIFFKLNSSNKVDEQFAEPLMYAVRRHFTDKKQEEVRAFARFKKRNYLTILISMAIVALLNFLLPMFVRAEVAKETGMTHFLDVFSFVIFYHPLTELLFNWNPYLKRINLLNKLIKAEAILVGNTENTGNPISDFDEYDAVEETERSFRI